MTLKVVISRVLRTGLQVSLLRCSPWSAWRRGAAGSMPLSPFNLGQSVDQVPGVPRRQFAVAAPLERWKVSGGHRRDLFLVNPRGLNHKSPHHEGTFTEEMVKNGSWWYLLRGMVFTSAWSISEAVPASSKTHTQRKEGRKDDSTTSSFPFMSFASRIVLDVILPCLPQCPTATSIDRTSEIM